MEPTNRIIPWHSSKLDRVTILYLTILLPTLTRCHYLSRIKQSAVESQCSYRNVRVVRVTLLGTNENSSLSYGKCETLQWSRPDSNSFYSNGVRHSSKCCQHVLVNTHCDVGFSLIFPEQLTRDSPDPVLTVVRMSWFQCACLHPHTRETSSFESEEI